MRMKESAHGRAMQGGRRGRSQAPGLKVFSVGDACAMLGISRSTLYKLIRVGELPAFKLSQGGRWRFKREDLEAWLEDRKSEELLAFEELG